jgi:hypothetical protein
MKPIGVCKQLAIQGYAPLLESGSSSSTQTILGYPAVSSYGWPLLGRETSKSFTLLALSCDLGGGERETFEVPALSGNVYRQLLREAGPVFQTLLVSAKALQEIGGLDEAIVAYQEWGTAIRLAKRFEFAFVPEPTFVYDCRGMDTISKNLLRGARGYEQILRKHLRDIALRAGPRAVSKHYARLSSEYRIAGGERLLEDVDTFHLSGGRVLVCRFGS